MITLDRARLVRKMHTPEHQDGNGYNRCALCSYVRHPCETWELADDLVTLLERGGDRARMGCPQCAGATADLADDHPPVMRCIVCGAGYWDADQ